MLDFGAVRLRGRARPIDEPGEAARAHGLFLGKYLAARLGSWLGGGFGRGRVVAVEALERDPSLTH